MPFYELTLIFKPLPRKETIDALRRAANLVWEQDGVLRKIDYLGFKKMAFAGRTSASEDRYNEGDHFIYHISMPQSKCTALLPELRLDTDCMRAVYFTANDTEFPKDYECTLEEELQTPFFRNSVQPLLGNKNVRANVRNFFSLKSKK